MFTNEEEKPMDKVDNSKALEAVKAEPKVMEAIITDADVLYVSVIDDGTSRKGYAEYLCEVLKDYNTTVTRVKVVKAGSTDDPNKDNAYGILLGECNCETYK
jgi:hypothetical protein